MAIIIGILAVIVILAMAGTFYLTNGTRTRGNSLESSTKPSGVRGNNTPQEHRAPGLN